MPALLERCSAELQGFLLRRRIGEERAVELLEIALRPAEARAFAAIERAAAGRFDEHHRRRAARGGQLQAPARELRRHPARTDERAGERDALGAGELFSHG